LETAQPSTPGQDPEQSLNESATLPRPMGPQNAHAFQTRSSRVTISYYTAEDWVKFTEQRDACIWAECQAFFNQWEIMAAMEGLGGSRSFLMHVTLGELEESAKPAVLFASSPIQLSGLARRT